MDKNLLLGIGIILGMAVAILAFLDMTGASTFLAAGFLFVLPAFLILDRFDLGMDEKLLFAFFLGIGLFAVPVYYLGMLIGIRAAAAATFVLSVGVGIGLRFWKRKIKPGAA
ncbi:MAG: hypothetical protein V1735_03250 [Nanoarchaeota archaeon]